MQGKNCSFWNMRISYLNLFNFFFCSCFPSTLALILQYKARSLRWAALLASTCSISFFVLVSPLPSFSFSRNAHCGTSFGHKRFLFMISLCFPYALALVFNCDAICDQWAPMLASTRSFLTFSPCFHSTIAQVLHTSTRPEGKQA